MPELLRFEPRLSDMHVKVLLQGVWRKTPLNAPQGHTKTGDTPQSYMDEGNPEERGRRSTQSYAVLPPLGHRRTGERIQSRESTRHPRQWFRQLPDDRVTSLYLRLEALPSDPVVGRPFRRAEDETVRSGNHQIITQSRSTSI